jgi:hypothetical protein
VIQAEMMRRQLAIGKVVRQDAKEMAFVEDDDVIGALALNRFDDSLDLRASPWRAHGRLGSRGP